MAPRLQTSGRAFELRPEIDEQADDEQDFLHMRQSSHLWCDRQTHGEFIACVGDNLPTLLAHLVREVRLAHSLHLA